MTSPKGMPPTQFGSSVIPPSGGPRSSDAPPPDLGQEKEQILRAFSRGTELTRLFMAEYDRLTEQVQVLQNENNRLKTIVEADDAIRELVKKIQLLEIEKSDLLQKMQKPNNSDDGSIFSDLEQQLADFANLHVAANFLHSSMTARGLLRRFREIFEQLMGVKSWALLLTEGDESGADLVLSHSVGLEEGEAPNQATMNRIASVIMSGSAAINDECDPSNGSFDNLPAILPLRVEDMPVGAICIVRCLSHKTKFSNTDFELFRLIGQHSAPAIVAAGLYEASGRKLPSFSVFGEVK